MTLGNRGLLYLIVSYVIVNNYERSFYLSNNFGNYYDYEISFFI